MFACVYSRTHPKVPPARRIEAWFRSVRAWIVLGSLCLAASGCHFGRCGSPGGPFSGAGWLAVASPFQAAGPAGAPSRQGQYAESLMAEEEEAPGAGSYILYGLVGVPRDAVAAVLEPAGYAVGVVGGIALNIVSLPIQFIYANEFKPIRPISRVCVMAPAFPFFFTSDILCRSFTGDMNRYRWGVHPFPRADNRFFPNYHAILGSGGE